MLEWIFHLKPTHPYQEGPFENIAPTNTVKNKFEVRAPAFLKVFVIAFLYKADITVVGTIGTQLRNLSEMGAILFQGGGN